jgi:hypothetical protein
MFADKGGAFLPAEPFIGRPWINISPGLMPTGRSPDALSQSNVDGTVSQCAVAISLRDVAITSSGPSLETSSFPCEALRQAERLREASAVEVAFLPATEPFVTFEDD